MQPPTNNNNPATVADPTNAFLNQLGPQQTASPVEEKNSSTGKAFETGKRGKSGTYIFNGIITREEYNPDLIRFEALKNYDIMRRSDATVRAALKVCMLPILSATWTIEAASDDQQDIDIADFVRWNLFENEITFSDVLSEIMTFLPFGYSVFEKIWDYVNWTPAVVEIPAADPPPPEPDENGVIPPATDKPEPNLLIRPSKKMIGLVGFESRKQRSIYRWQTNDVSPVFGVTQYVPGGTYSIPGDKLTIFTLDKEGENYEGISLLRAAYKHWKMKDTLELIDAIRHERQGLGIIEIIPPEGANEDDIDDAIDAARAARSSEEGVIKHPNGWVFEWMDMKGSSTTLTDIMGSLEYHKREILKSVLAQFLELGSKGGSGSRATSQDHSDLFQLAEEFTAKYIGNVFGNSVIKEMVDLNFSDVKHYPKLEHSKIGDDNLTLIGTVLNQLGTAGLITPDPDLEQWIRTALHAPDLPDDAREDYDSNPARKNQPMVVPAPGVTTPNQVPEPATEDDNPDDSAQSTTAKDALTNAKQARAKLIDTLLG